MEIDMKEYSTAELKEMCEIMRVEIQTREKAAREGEWNTIKQAIKNWCDKYGPIEIKGYVDEKYYLNEDSFFAPGYVSGAWDN